MQPSFMHPGREVLLLQHRRGTLSANLHSAIKKSTSVPSSQAKFATECPGKHAMLLRQNTIHALFAAGEAMWS